MIKTISNIILLTLCCINYSCENQPVDANLEKKEELSKYAVKGGYHQPCYLGFDDAPYGYYFFTPENAVETNEKFPLLVFLHGYGERGNSKTNNAALDKILVSGPCMMIDKETWEPSFEMFVASPQCHGNWWNRDMLKQFIEFLIESNNQIDTTRIYLTGLSMGGYATFDLLTSFGIESHIAAAVPICGSGVLSDYGNNNISKIPLWVFHGDADKTVTPEYSKAIVPAINALNPEVSAKLTIYPGVGHNSWSMTYDGTGMGKEDPEYDSFDQDIFSWMYQYKREEEN